MSRDQDPPPDGYQWAWVPAREIPGELRWELVQGSQAKQCRWTDQRVRCTNLSVVRLNRAHTAAGHPRWWHYCEQHLFGRRINNLVIETCILVPDGPAWAEEALS